MSSRVPFRPKTFYDSMTSKSIRSDTDAMSHAPQHPAACPCRASQLLIRRTCPPRHPRGRPHERGPRVEADVFPPRRCRGDPFKTTLQWIYRTYGNRQVYVWVFFQTGHFPKSWRSSWNRRQEEGDIPLRYKTN